MLYEMLTGLPPYYDENTNEMYRKILSEPLHFPGPDIVPPAAKDLLTRLLDRRPEQRLGANGASEIKAHQFFHSIDWRKLLQRKYEPTFKPNVVCKAFRSPCLPSLMANLRPMLWILRILIVNSPPRRPQTPTSTVRCFHRPCSNNLPAGLTIALLLVSEMLVAV